MGSCFKLQTAKDQMTFMWSTASSLNRKPLSFTLCLKAAANLNYFVILRVRHLKLKDLVFQNFEYFEGGCLDTRQNEHALMQS